MRHPPAPKRHPRKHRDRNDAVVERKMRHDRQEKLYRQRELEQSR